jgi:hypothetical protein
MAFEVTLLTSMRHLSGHLVIPTLVRISGHLTESKP